MAEASASAVAVAVAGIPRRAGGQGEPVGPARVWWREPVTRRESAGAAGSSSPRHSGTPGDRSEPSAADHARDPGAFAVSSPRAKVPIEVSTALGGLPVPSYECGERMNDRDRLGQLEGLLARLEQMPASPERDWMLAEVRGRAVDVKTGMPSTPLRALPRDEVQVTLPAERAPRDRATAAEAGT